MTRRDRWLALALLLAVIGAVYLVVIHPLWTVPMQQQAQRIDTLQQRELRARTLLAQAPDVARALERAQRLQQSTPGFLPESTPELATSGLARHLETVVAQASPGNRGCAITNRSPLSASTQQGRYARAAVQVRLRCGMAETVAVLHMLESGSPRLFVDNLNILAERYFQTPDQAARSGGLDVSFDLHGYLRPHADRRDAARTPTDAR